MHMAVACILDCMEAEQELWRDLVRAERQPTDIWAPSDEYQKLIDAEQTVEGVAYAGELPGLLFACSYMPIINRATQAGDTLKGQQQIELLDARGCLFGARLALGQVSLRAIMPSDTFEKCRANAWQATGKDRDLTWDAVADQADVVEHFVENEWLDMVMVPPDDPAWQKIGNGVKVSVLLSSSGPDSYTALYQELDVPDMPHEIWSTDPAVIEQQASAHQDLIRQSLLREETREILSRWAT